MDIFFGCFLSYEGRKAKVYGCLNGRLLCLNDTFLWWESLGGEKVQRLSSPFKQSHFKNRRETWSSLEIPMTF